MSDNDNDTKKRPRGLKRSSLASPAQPPSTAAEDLLPAKKPRLEKDDDLEDETQTLIIDKDVEGDEVAEVMVIYESAVEKLATTPKAALPLLRGTIHECDRILRNHHVSSPPLPASLHLTYGSALFHMGTVLEEEEVPEPYWDAARERLEVGLECVEEAIAKEEREGDEGKRERQEVEKGLRMTLGRVMISKATNILLTTRDINAPIKKALSQLLVDATMHFDRAFSLPLAPATAPDLCIAASSVQLYADRHDDEEPRLRWNEWAKKIFVRVLEDDPAYIPALMGAGSCLLSIAGYWLEQQNANNGSDEDNDDDEEEEEEKELTKEEKAAEEALIEGTAYFQSALSASETAGTTTSEILAMLAESQINLANLTSDADGAQTTLYRHAVAHLRHAVAKPSEGWVLPAGLESFLSQWEVEMGEGEGEGEDGKAVGKEEGEEDG